MKHKGYGLRFFNSNTSEKRKRLILIFAVLLMVIILMQVFYWVFANSALPIIAGLPFGMFFITGTIILEFVILLVMEKVLFSDVDGEAS